MPVTYTENMKTGKANENTIILLACNNGSDSFLFIWFVYLLCI